VSTKSDCISEIITKKISTGLKTGLTNPNGGGPNILPQLTSGDVQSIYAGFSLPKTAISTNHAKYGMNPIGSKHEIAGSGLEAWS
jgi:hypothetical protein